MRHLILHWLVARVQRGRDWIFGVEDNTTQEIGLCKDDCMSLLSILITHWIHQNQLMWGRLQTILALQVAGIAATWAGGKRWGWVVMIFVTLITAVFFIIFALDRKCRDSNLAVIRGVQKKISAAFNNGEHDVNGVHPELIKLGLSTKMRTLSSYVLLGFVIILMVADVSAGIASCQGSFGRPQGQAQSADLPQDNPSH